MSGLGVSLCGALTLALLSASIAAEASEGRLKVTVMDLAVHDAEREVAALVRDIAAQELAKASELEVLTHEDLSSLISVERQKQLFGCNEEASCASQLGSVVQSDRLLKGSVSKVGGSYLVSLQMVDVHRGQVERRATFRSGGTTDALAAATRSAVAQLRQVPAKLHLYDQVPGAKVLLDDELLGTTPLSPVPVHASGEATLRVEHHDYPAFERRVSLVPGNTTRVRLGMMSFAELESASSRRRAWGYGSAGLAVAGFAGGGLLVGGGMTQWRRLDAADPRRVTQAELNGIADSARMQLATGYAALGTGAAAAALSAYLLLADPWREELEAAK
ncbi:MAG: PEGA domain-containing protein [Myxococcales bacterium]|nr:PEGA domain-containing protein [Myxococcales bacterium]